MNEKTEKIINDLSHEDLKKLTKEALEYFEISQPFEYDIFAQKILNKYIKFSEEELIEQINYVIEEMNLIENGEYVFESEYDYDTYDYEYTVPYQILTIINDTIKVAIELFDKKDYHQCIEILKRLLNLNATVIDDNHEIVDYDLCINLIDDTELLLCRSSIEALYIHSIYLCNKNLKKITDVLNESYFQMHILEDLKKRNISKDFYYDLIDYLVSKNQGKEKTVSNVLFFIDDNDKIINLMKQYGENYPEIYLSYFEKINIYEDKDFLTYANLAIEKIKNPLKRASIEIMYVNYYHHQKEENKEFEYLLKAFSDNTSLDNIFGLLYHPKKYFENFELIKEQIVKQEKFSSENELYPFILDYKTMLNELAKEEYLSIYEHQNISEFFVFLLLLIKNENMNQEYLEYITNLNFYYNRYVNEKSIYTYQITTNRFEILNKFIKEITIDNDLWKEIYKAVITYMTNMISFILECKIKERYEYASILLKILDDLLYTNGDKNKNECLQFYLKKYSRYRSFKKFF